MRAKTVNNIIKTTKNLKHFSLNMTMKSITSLILQNIIKKAIILNKKLEHIEFACNMGSNQGVKSALKGVKSGFQKSKNNNTKHLMINIYTTYSNTKAAYSIFPNLKKLLYFFNDFGIKDFMVVWDENSPTVNKKLLVKKLKFYILNMSITLQNNYIILITNKKCKINGFHITRPGKFNLPEFQTDSEEY